MEPFTRLTSVAASLPAADIDTDIIFPARFLLITAKAGLGRYAFYEWRYQPDGAPRPEFVLNQPAFAGARILIAGPNFGCGSSREQAPWALHDLGIRCVIAPSFGEIFFSNCFRNGMLPIVAAEADIARLQAETQSGAQLSVDLATCEIVSEDGQTLSFEIDPWRRDALLNGWDEVAVILNSNMTAVARFEAGQRARMAWLYAGEQ